MNYTTLEVSKDTYKEIQDKLLEAGCGNQVLEGGLDMHGIALQAEKRSNVETVILLASVLAAMGIVLIKAVMVWKIIQWYHLKGPVIEPTVKQVVGLLYIVSFLPGSKIDQRTIRTWEGLASAAWRAVYSSLLVLGIAYLTGKLL